MSKLPADLSGQDLRKALQRVGFVLIRQRGSHMILRREIPTARVIIPDHKSIRPGTLSQILKAADLTVNALLDLL
jgi:predicted RNA binding protein YcfA (HicA-like mRNA interferase family)